MTNGIRARGVAARRSLVGASAARPRSRSSRRPRISASLAREVGGDKVTVESLAKGYQDPHFVEPKPSFILKLHTRRPARSSVGRELEIGWLPPLITQSRNAKIQPGGAGYLDASLTCADPRDCRPGRSRARWATCIRSGNPHYWLDPGNGRLHRQGDPGQADASSLRPTRRTSRSAYADFDRRLAEAEKRWKAAMAPYKGLKVVTYHRSWPNFAERFGLDVDRLRRAEARHPAVAVAHARPDPGDEARRASSSSWSSRTST